MSLITVGVVKYYLKNGFYIVGDNSTTKGNGITDSSYSGEIIINDIINGKVVKEIGQYAFKECEGITKVTIHAKLTSINYLSFHVCTKLDYVNIPATVTFIGNGAFAFWSRPTTPMFVEFNKGRKEKVYICTHGFSERKIFKIIYPSSLEPLYDTSSQFVSVSEATICAYKSFSFCNRFNTVIDMSQCPSPQYKAPNRYYITIGARLDIRSHIIIYLIIALLCEY